MRNSIWIAAALGLLVACAQAPQKSAVANKDDSISCLKETGSRIPTKPGECNDKPGRVVTREEMERSGGFTTFDVIKQTVPQAH
jgi:hypothetical protein